MDVNAELQDAPFSADGTRIGREAVAGQLTGVDAIAGLNLGQYIAAAQFISYVMFTVQLANGDHPRTASEFIPGEGRGQSLARGLLEDGVAPLCCDYCAYLMALALSLAAAKQMAVIHGTTDAARQWHQLTYALAGPALEPGPPLP